MKMNKLLRTRGQHHFVESNSQAQILTHSVEQTLIQYVGWGRGVCLCLFSDVSVQVMFTLGSCLPGNPPTL